MYILTVLRKRGIYLSSADFGFNYQVLHANQDSDTVVYNKLISPITARYIRLLPVTWYNHISLRMELYGCRGISWHDGIFVRTKSLLVSQNKQLFSFSGDAKMGVKHLWTYETKFNMQTKHSATKIDKRGRKRAKKTMHREKLVYKTSQGKKTS